MPTSEAAYLASEGRGVPAFLAPGGRGVPAGAGAAGAGAQDRLIIALDHPDAGSALEQVGRLSGVCRWYKIGLELFCACGPPIVEAVRAREGRVFLDLKMHDIPETVARAVRRAAGLGVELCTVHADGGLGMMRRAQEAAAGTGLRVLAVTVLTSLELADLHAVGACAESVGALVEQRARLAQEAGVSGVIASPQEVSLLRAACGPGFAVVTPGVRAAGEGQGDQKRTGSALQAIIDGADMLVVGRPVRDAPDPAAAARGLLREIEDGLRRREEAGA